MSQPGKPNRTGQAPPGKGAGALVKCPICGKPAADRQAAQGQRSPFPFCSERCRLVDLGRWLDGAYQIPADVADLDESQPPPADEA